MMEVFVNNLRIEIPENYTLEKLIKKMSYPNHVAVWINGKQILLKEYSTKVMNHDDKIVIIKPLAGG